MTAAEAYFYPDGDGFVASELTRGPWSPRHQHGGPPAALVARAMEGQWPELHLSRLTIEFLRPVPIGSLAVKLEVFRAGRRVVRSVAWVMVDGEAVAHASGLLLRPAPVAVAAPIQAAHLTPPEAGTPFSFPFFRDPVSYDTSVETRIAHGRFGSGAVFAWMRQRIPLVLGESPSPAQRVCVLADSGSGVGAILDRGSHPMLNADLTVAIHRPPEGEWIGLDALTIPEPTGLGLTRTVLHDRRGRIGEALQNLLAEPR